MNKQVILKLWLCQFPENIHILLSGIGYTVRKGDNPWTEVFIDLLGATLTGKNLLPGSKFFPLRDGPNFQVKH